MSEEINPLEYWKEKASPQALQELSLENRALQTQPDELKPCPLPACGGIAKRHRVSNPVLDNYYDHSIKCSKCGLQTAYVPIRVDNPVPPQMYDRWNTRSTPDQQAYDRAMAHNAMLRDMLRMLQGDGKGCPVCDYMYEEKHEESCELMATLNATEADVEAWEERRDKKVRDAYRAGPYTDACKQLATVTNERDALREGLKISTGTVESITEAMEAIATITTERDAALAHVATMVERLELLKCTLRAPAFVKGEHRNTWWHSSYTSILNDIDVLVATTKPGTIALLERLKRFAILSLEEKLKIETETKMLMEALHPDLMAHREVALEEARTRLREEMEQVCVKATEAKKAGKK